MIVMFMTSFVGATDALPMLIVLFMNMMFIILGATNRFLYWSSSSQSMVIMLFIYSFLGVVDAILMLMILFLVYGDHDVHELLSWCC